MTLGLQTDATIRKPAAQRIGKTISFYARKGGSGRTTAAVLFAGELARRGASVTLIEADGAAILGRLPNLSSRITVIAAVTEDKLGAAIEKARYDADYILIDVASYDANLARQAIGASDFVVYTLGAPSHPEEIDDVGAFMADLGLRRGKRAAGGVLLTQVPVSMKDQMLNEMERLFQDKGVGVFKERFRYRAAFRELVAAGGSVEALETTEAFVAARQDIEALTSELLGHLAQAA